VQPNFFRGYAKAVIIDGSDVGPKKLESNGACDIMDLSRDRLVRKYEGGWGGLKRLEAPDDGCGSFHRAKEWVRCGRLGDILVAGISFLPFKMNCHFVGCLEKR